MPRIMPREGQPSEKGNSPSGPWLGELLSLGHKSGAEGGDISPPLTVIYLFWERRNGQVLNGTRVRPPPSAAKGALLDRHSPGGGVARAPRGRNCEGRATRSAVRRPLPAAPAEGECSACCSHARRSRPLHRLWPRHRGSAQCGEPSGPSPRRDVSARVRGAQRGRATASAMPGSKPTSRSGAPEGSEREGSRWTRVGRVGMSGGRVGPAP